MTRTIEFETELTGGPTLTLPPGVAGSLPPSGKATVVIAVDMDPEDSARQHAAYEEFLSEASAEDAVYGTYR